MGFRSVVFGHIHTLDNQAHEANRQALQAFPYDELYPFPNIFHIESAPRYKAPSIIFGGTFKQVEDDWHTWFDRFAALLSTLEAIEANVILDCWLGRYAWTLAPEVLAQGGSVTAALDERGTLTGERWCIIQAPAISDDLQDQLAPAGILIIINPAQIYGY
ncbi:hypothetical protein DEDE109153_11980 [Deinococcus deserti]|uniref:Uncharacterized protein n=1 Tax=Deinococcus deserti (strain DSM 17065 / CIP 109153 / LMG 22923 / VCD115) TaxID=546414 RepID=C1D3A9_DEIDV|nr:hypothetical protein [Deinococcus deserti]ACO47898.1 Hypothetical protein Deide_2p02250 [Deinococcus deserti VCD115]